MLQGVEAVRCVLLGSAKTCHLHINIHLPPSQQMARHRGLAGRHDTCLCWPGFAVYCSLLWVRFLQPTAPPAPVWLPLSPASESAWGCYHWSMSRVRRKRGDLWADPITVTSRKAADMERKQRQEQAHLACLLTYWKDDWEMKRKSMDVLNGTFCLVVDFYQLLELNCQNLISAMCLYRIKDCAIQAVHFPYRLC